MNPPVPLKKQEQMQVFGENGEYSARNALKDFSELEKVWNHLKETSLNPQILSHEIHC